jgi:hypothetical protein
VRLVFAIETACSLWETLAFFLCDGGYTIVLVSPLSTHHARPIMSMEFSRTDPKDAYLVATVAQRGAFQPSRSHFAAHFQCHCGTWRRGRCFADIDLINSLPRPVRGKGVFALPTAAAIRAFTSDCSNTSDEFKRMKRV